MPYLTARTKSHAENAMVAAENATRVPMVLDNSDAHRGRGANYDKSKEQVMAYCKEAMDHLDKVHWSDDITRDLVRSKIGKAQKRAGLQ